MYNTDALSETKDYGITFEAETVEYKLRNSVYFNLLEATAKGVSQKMPIVRFVRCRDAFDIICTNHYQAQHKGAELIAPWDEYSTASRFYGYNYVHKRVLAAGYKPRISTDDRRSFILVTVPGRTFARVQSNWNKFAVPIFKKTGITVPTIHHSKVNSGKGAKVCWTGVVVEVPDIYLATTFGCSFLTQVIRGSFLGHSAEGYSLVSIIADDDGDDAIFPGLFEAFTNNRRVGCMSFIAPYIKGAIKAGEGVLITERDESELLDYGIQYLLLDVFRGLDYSEMYEDAVNFLQDALSNN